MILIVLYVDDILIARDNTFELQLVKADICKRLKMKDLREADEFLAY